MRWCPACRQEVIRRASNWARAAALLVALLVGLWIATAMRSTRFLVAWMLLLAASYALVYKIVQRVAFEIIRARRVPVPEEKDV
jgi:hypothetical protein